MHPKAFRTRLLRNEGLFVSVRPAHVKTVRAAQLRQDDTS